MSQHPVGRHRRFATPLVIAIAILGPSGCSGEGPREPFSSDGANLEDSSVCNVPQFRNATDFVFHNPGSTYGDNGQVNWLRDGSPPIRIASYDVLACQPYYYRDFGKLPNACVFSFRVDEFHGLTAGVTRLCTCQKYADGTPACRLDDDPSTDRRHDLRRPKDGVAKPKR